MAKLKGKVSRSVELALRQWRAPTARRLLVIYEDAKRQGALISPEHWAGSLLLIHGSRCLEAFDVLMGVVAFKVPEPSVIRKLLIRSVNEELAIEHGPVLCFICERTALPTLDWRCRIAQNKSGRQTNSPRSWRCPECQQARKGLLN